MKTNKRELHNFYVVVEPVLPMLPPNVTANQSQRVELNCFADANPPVARYNWTKDGILLADTAAVYVIPSAQVSFEILHCPKKLICSIFEAFGSVEVLCIMSSLLLLSNLQIL